MRRSNIAFALIIAGTGLSLATLADSQRWSGEAAARQTEARRWVRLLGLTDLCLFTEARYTRHPSQADWHTAFQDHPFALEHFPSGTLLAPPAHVRDVRAPLD